ncbi:MAG TPA: DUF87 domain-containing protein [archaeon]|nr:DUF87 domain-containing protein [archaeon]
METRERIFTDEIKKLTPILGAETVSNLAKSYLLADEDTRKRIVEVVDAMRAAVATDKELKNSILVEPPERGLISGDIELGNILFGKKKLFPFSIKSSDLLSHMGIFGSSGYGKTNIAYCLTEKLSEKGIPVIIFDFSKRNYKDILNTKMKKNTYIYTVGRDIAPFKFNPLKPPEGVQLSQWMKEFAVVFDHAYWLLGGGRYIILKGLSSVYDAKNEPRMNDIKDWLLQYSDTKMSSREKNWVATAERPLESLCFREIGEIFNCDKGVTPDEFFQPGRITILELDAIDTNDKTFLIEIILQWIRDWLLVSGEREKLKGVIILEEAHHILNRQKASKLGSETVIDLVFREVRELGLGVVYLDQHPSLVSYPALGNTSTNIYMNLGLDTKHSSDILDASNMLGFDEDDSNFLRQLPVGNGFVLCRKSSFPKPFVAEFYPMDIKKGSVSDEEIREHMKTRIKEELPEIKEQVKKTKKEIRMEDVDEFGWRIMSAIGHGDGSYTSQIYKATRMSGTVFNDKADFLANLGILGYERGKAGRNKLYYYFLTEDGQKIFDMKFGRMATEESANIESLLHTFKLDGWNYEEKNGLVIFEKAGKKLEIMIETSTDITKIREDLKKSRRFLCSSERTKNSVITQAAKRVGEGDKSVLFIATIEEFDKSGIFEEIDFNPEWERTKNV